MAVVGLHDAVQAKPANTLQMPSLHFSHLLRRGNYVQRLEPKSKIMVQSLRGWAVWTESFLKETVWIQDKASQG